MITTDAIPISYFVASQSTAIGAEVVVLPAEREAPGYWGSSYVSLPLHTDGSACLNSSSCACGVEDRTVISEGETLAVGDWIWQAGRSWVVGWHRTGPSAAEQALAERAEVLAEDLDAERGNHRVTAADLNHNIQQVKRLAAELEAARADAALLQRNVDTVCGERDAAQRALRRTANRWAWGSGAVVLALVLALVWAVIA